MPTELFLAQALKCEEKADAQLKNAKLKGLFFFVTLQ